MRNPAAQVVKKDKAPTFDRWISNYHRHMTCPVQSFRHTCSHLGRATGLDILPLVIVVVQVVKEDKEPSIDTWSPMTERRARMPSLNTV